MMLYNMASAALLKALDGRLQGIELDGGRMAASSYVDDTVAVLRDAEDVAVLTDTLGQFGNESGLKVNPTKSKVLIVGRWGAPVPFPSVDAVKILGVTFTARSSKLAANNWPGRVGAARATLVDARLRAFNLVQRVQYANTYVLPLLWHLAQVVPLPVKHAAATRKGLGRFIWAAKRVRVPFDVLVQPKQRGGLGLHDPARKARAMFVARWETSARSEMKTLSGGWLRQLQQQYSNGEAIPACAAYFRGFNSVTRGDTEPVGKGLARALYSESLDVNVPTPRSMREASSEAQTAAWQSVHNKIVPVDARSTWYEAVHDVLPTAIRLQAANQAVTPDCPKCAEPEDVIHRLARCGEARRAAWAWAALNIEMATGVVVTEATITRPQLRADGPRGQAALWTVAVVVHHLATTSSATVAGLRQYISRRRAEVSAEVSQHVLV